MLVGPNGCGKTSLFEAFNHWYRLNGFSLTGDKTYSIKKEEGVDFDADDWYNRITRITIDFHDETITGRDSIQGKFYFRSAYRNDPDFTIQKFSRQENPKYAQKNNLMSTDATVSSNYQRLVSSVISGVADCLAIKTVEMNNSITRGNAADDVKSASGPIMVSLKKKLGLTRCGNTLESFFHDTIVPLITPDTMVYLELESSIFG